jgi:hypothetical protein
MNIHNCNDNDRENDILFYINNKINTIHNEYLSFTRNI